MSTHKKYFQGLIFILSHFSAIAAYAANQLEGIRIWAAPESTRVVFDLSQAPQYSYFTLKQPDRVVVDLKQGHKAVDLKKIANNSQLVKGIRVSRPPDKQTLRLVIDLNQAVEANLFALAPTAPYGDRLVVDLEQRSTPPKNTIKQAPKAMRDVIVAIDAGHGGDDPGSIAASGVYEKQIVLQIARKIAAKINATPGMKAVMTRTGDYFVNLNKRSEIARKNKADLLVSVHADAFTSAKPQGASVWILSMRRANSEIGRWLEKKEKHSELLGGAGEIIKNTDDEQYLAMILLDMSMDRSLAESHHVASNVLAHLDDVTRLHKSKPEAASLAVLKSPDIPSILVETGFISNKREAKLLTQKEHQTRLSNAIYKGVLAYFKAKPPADSLFASKGAIQHTVRRGESLSVLAQRYRVSMNKIKTMNNLKSNGLQIGQQLIIPQP